ncbi:MAG: hypothetical protein KBS74_04540 [Clostridiales bacterium]|nr:hypothetical protein [Candidatus Cacconaster stercorequi]
MANILFVFPLILGVLTAVIFVFVLSVISMVATHALPFSGGGVVLFSHCFLSGTIFSVLFVCGVWFLLVQAAFHRHKRTRIVHYIVIVLSVLAFIFITSELLFRQGYYNPHTLRELPELFSPIWMNVGAAVFAVGSGIFAWKRCLHLYRADLKGQRRAKQESYAPMALAESKKPQVVDGKNKALLLILPVAILVLFGLAIRFTLGGGSFDSGTSFCVETQNISDYALWDSNGKKAGIPRDLDYISSGLLIFPEHVDEKTAVEYYARFAGKYGDGWASCSWTRFLVLQLPQEEYAAEKQRIANLSVTYGKQTNHVIHDTAHFPWEAYLAVLDNGENEYALFDDARKQVIYVYDNGDDPQLSVIPTQQSYLMQTVVSPITARQANDDGGGFSIYSFRDTHGYCTIWWPGMYRLS